MKLNAWLRILFLDRIAKLLRQSFRRSVIRIAHVLGSNDATSPSTSASNVPPTFQRQLPPPPDYSTVLVEINQSRGNNIPAAVVNPSQIIIQTENIQRCVNENSSSSALTAQDVANILRSSLRRNKTLPARALDSRNNLIEQECSSIQCLVDSATPINRDSIVTMNETKREEQSA